MGFLAASVPSCIDQDKRIILLQRGDLAKLIPALQTISEPMLEHQ
jgi:hypothetical protein